jgi:hypothetical protein
MHQYNNQYNNITIEQYSNRIGVTLLELLIAITLLSVIVIGFTSIDMFSRYHVLTADRRAKVQNEVSYVLEHMSKEISKAIGDSNNLPVVIDDSNRRVKVYIDYNPDGQRGTGDRWIAYRYRDSSAPEAERYQLWYCPQCTDSTCGVCTPDDWNSTGFINNGYVLSRKITSFSPTYDNTETDGDPRDDYLEIQSTIRWDPAQAVSFDNPEVTMSTRIKMPSVSTN